MKIKTNTTFYILTASLLCYPAILAAQDEPVEELEEYDFEELVADPVGIIPERPTATLYGSDRSVLESPRSVSMIEGEMLDRYGVRTVDDFISVAAGTFTDNFFGIAGSLDIRGSLSDTYFRGFRRVANEGVYVTPITSTSRVEVVKGPPNSHLRGRKDRRFHELYPQERPNRNRKVHRKTDRRN